MSQLTEPLKDEDGHPLTHRPRVVIVGSGFGGLQAAIGLAKLPVDVTVVDRRNHYTFQPLLYQVALAVLSPADIAQPIRSILRKHQNTQVLMDEVTSIDVAARQVTLGSGARVPYDYLVLATGATHSYFAHPEWAPLAPGLKTIEDATEIRRRVLLAFELAERQMVEHGWHPPLNFVVIGGGPTGVELAGAISDIAQLYMRHDFRHIDPSKARVLLLEGSPRVLAAYPDDLSAKAEAALTKLGVEVHTNTKVNAVGPGWVEAAGKDGDMHIDAVVTLWAAGVQASPLGKLLGAPLDRRGCVEVDDRLNPPGLPEIFVLGDLAHLEQDGHRSGRQAAPRLPLLRQGRHGHHRPHGRRGQGRVALQGPHERLPRLGRVARRPHLLLDRLSQPRLRLRRMGLDLLHLHARRAADHRGPAAARLARPTGRWTSGKADGASF
jgi:NADH dehydrogenase